MIFFNHSLKKHKISKKQVGNRELEDRERKSEDRSVPAGHCISTSLNTSHFDLAQYIAFRLHLVTKQNQSNALEKYC